VTPEQRQLFGPEVAPKIEIGSPAKGVVGVVPERPAPRVVAVIE
jgi:hypothetical protein